MLLQNEKWLSEKKNLGDNEGDREGVHATRGSTNPQILYVYSLSTKIYPPISAGLFAKYLWKPKFVKTADFL